MIFIANVFESLGNVCVWLGKFSARVGYSLHGFLPVFLKPKQLADRLNTYYSTIYYGEGWIKDPENPVGADFRLEEWEAKVCSHFAKHSGHMLVLGCGHGRETISIAEKKMVTIGLDRHPGVLKIATHVAAHRNVPAFFVQADFTSLPFKQTSFDYALLADTMYSAIPGKLERQTMLRDLSKFLKKNSIAILSYKIDQPSRFGLSRVFSQIKRVLSQFPGANSSYQIGDVYHTGHYFHCFQQPEELRKEIEEIGGIINELNWDEQYVVLRFSS